MHDAQRRIGRVVALCGGFVAVLIGGPVVLSITSVDGSVLGSERPFVDSLALTAGPRLSAVLCIGIATATFNALIVTVITTARLYYANGRDGIFPARVNWLLTRVHGRFYSPWIATLVVGAIGAVFCLLGLHKVILLLAGEVFSGALVALSVLVGRLLGRTGRTGFRTPWFPAVPLFGLVVAVGLVAGTYADPDAGRPSMMILLGVIAVAALYYQLSLRPRGWRVHLPSETGPAKER